MTSKKRRLIADHAMAGVGGFIGGERKKTPLPHEWESGVSYAGKSALQRLASVTVLADKRLHGLQVIGQYGATFFTLEEVRQVRR